MRLLVAAMLMAPLAGCGSEVPSPAERLAAEEAARAQSPRQQTRAVTLSGRGLEISGRDLPFSSNRDTVEAAIDQAVGTAPDRMENPECGAGPIAVSRYPSGLQLNFQNHVFVGWFFDGGDGDEDGSVGLASGVAPGMSAGAIQAVAGYEPIHSTLDGEFSLGGTIGGFTADGAVASLYAGTNCFFR